VASLCGFDRSSFSPAHGCQSVTAPLWLWKCVCLSVCLCLSVTSQRSIETARSIRLCLPSYISIGLAVLQDTQLKKKQSKVNTSINGYSSSQSNLPHRYENSHAIQDRSVTCHPAEVTFPPLPQPKLVLDLATPELTGARETDRNTDRPRYVKTCAGIVGHHASAATTPITGCGIELVSVRKS